MFLIILGILQIIIQLFLVFHVISTGRFYGWLILILFVPFAGSLAYFFLVWFPEFQEFNNIKWKNPTMRKIFNPGKVLVKESKSKRCTVKQLTDLGYR